MARTVSVFSFPISIRSNLISRALCLITSFLGTYLGAFTPDYIGANGSEALLRFSFFVSMEVPTSPSSKMIRKAIEKQVSHLFGPMIAATVPGIPKGNHSIKLIGTPTKSGSTYRASYDYEGTVVVKNSTLSEMDIPLPLDPEKIYSASGKWNGLNPCTDETYNDEDTFWYFWFPEREHCSLSEGKDYARVKAHLTPFANTPVAFPEYERLIRPSASGPRISVSIFLGMDDPNLNDPNPSKSQDEAAINYRRVREQLVEMNFTVGLPWSKQKLDQFLGKKIGEEPFFVEEFQRTTPKGLVSIRLFFGPIGIQEKSTAFHWLYREALRNASIIIYDGHSGFGEHLDLERIEQQEKFKFSLAQDYQIYFFNSCSSYYYYQSEYFDRKKNKSDPKGTKALDILSNGLLSAYLPIQNVDLVLVKSALDFALHSSRTSYPSILKELDDSNLAGVMGEEDNPIQVRDATYR